jgi:hypothetical protein
MKKIFTHTAGYVVYDDSVLTNNPSKQFGNWKRSSYNIEVEKPSGPQELYVPNGSSVVAFSGTRAITTNASTDFNLQLNPVKTSTYRLTWNGNGTFSGFRTKRSIDFNGVTVTLTVNNNATMLFSSSVNISTAQVGDVVFIPATSTGDAASPFSESNVGYWVITTKNSSTSFSATRLPGETFNGVSEAVAVTASTQVVIFSNSPVEVGDSISISSGFSPVTLGYYTVSALSWNWIEFVSTNPLPLESAIVTGLTGLTIFSNAKRWVRIEADSNVVLRFNNSTENTLELIPRTTLSDAPVAWFDSWGLFWKLEIVNNNPTKGCTIILSSVE